MGISRKSRIRILFLAITAALFVATAISIGTGKYAISPDELFSILKGDPRIPDMTRKVFFTLRLPRTLMAIMAGIALGVAGNVYQTIFKNPLASPDIIGVAGGANLGAAAAIVLVSSAGMLPIAIGAFWGGLLAVLCVMALTRMTGSNHTATYVLAGIVINAISKSLIMLLKYFADPENELAAMAYWEMGSFGNITLSKLASVLPLFLIGLVGLILLRRQIELMSLGDNESRALGVRLKPLRTAVLLLSTLLVASTTCITGLISFIGLIAPHTARLMLKRSDSVTMCMSGLTGGLVVLIADILARTLHSSELPVSILTTVIGVPFLVYFMCKRRGATL